MKLHTFYYETNKIFHAYIKPVFSKNKEVECPFCSWSGKNFLPFGVLKRENALCPKCSSLERHRLYFLYLKNILPKKKQLKVLHFAPEKIIREIFLGYKNIEYLSADINPSRAMVKEDITKTSFKKNSFDIIFCSHVLEHIVEDKKAMKEICRVLKPKGFAILQVPISKKTITLEDPNVVTFKEREKIFGQGDHVRFYGLDFKERLKECGFEVKVDKFFYTLDKKIINKYGLIPEEIYVCYKN